MLYVTDEQRNRPGCVGDEGGKITSTSLLSQSETQAYLAAIVSSSTDAILSTDLNGRIQSWNGAAERIYGYSAGEAIGRPIAILIPPELEDRLADDAGKGIAGDSIPPHETVRLRKDGARITVSVAVSPVRDSSGRVIGASSIQRDITEIKRLERYLVLTERLVSVGTLAAGVAHEINNPLAYVIENSRFAGDKLLELGKELPSLLRPDAGPRASILLAHIEEAREALEEAMQGADRVRQIVRDLRTFSRGEDDERSWVDVRQVLDSATKVAWSVIRGRARLEKTYREVPLVQANEARLGQVFLNLLVNAAQAIPQGAPEEHEICVSTLTDEAGRAVTEVRDTGSGIAPEHLSRIFDPFFTTKSVGVGTGLGLSICHGIVTALGGQISVESRVSFGSTFRVVLPVRLSDSG